MIPDAPAVGLFVVAALALLVVTGPAVVYVVARSIREGRRTVLASVLGIHVGTLVPITPATLGLSARIAVTGTVYVGLGVATALASSGDQPPP